MGIDKRIVDSAGNEALVTAALNALKIDLIDSAGTTINDLETTLNAIETLLGGTAKVKVTDGTNTLNLVKPGSFFTYLEYGIPSYAYRLETGNFDAIGTAYYLDSVKNKGQRILPIIPMTGGREEGTFTRGLIPETEYNNSPPAQSVANASWVTIASNTVPADTTFWLCDVSVEPDAGSAGIEFRWRVTVNNVRKFESRVIAGNGAQHAFHSPIKTTTGLICRLQAYQWSGGAVDFVGTIHGFDTVDSELD